MLGDVRKRRSKTPTPIGSKVYLLWLVVKSFIFVEPNPKTGPARTAQYFNTENIKRAGAIERC